MLDCWSLVGSSVSLAWPEEEWNGVCLNEHDGGGKVERCEGLADSGAVLRHWEWRRKSD